jgi:Glycosyltransferase
VTTERPRLLLVTRNLPPLVGGMERLNWHLAAQLAQYASVHLIGPKGAAALAPAGVVVDEVALRPLWRFLLVAAWRALRQARRWRPAIVLAGSGLTAPLAWLTARACAGRAAVYVHGLDLAVRHPVYRWLWHPFLRRMDCVIANSEPTAALARAIGIPAARITRVPPGVELPPPDDGAASRLRRTQQLESRPLLLSVGRLSARKGLCEFVSEVLPRIVAARPAVLLLVVGDVPSAALHAQAQTPERISATARAAGVAGALRFLGVVQGAELTALYRAADVHVFPVRQIAGDPEGFGMVAIEAAACALPTVAYATGGVVEAVREGVSGHLIAPHDAAAFARAVLDLLNTPPPAQPLLDFAADFAWPRFGARVAAALGLGP